MRTKGSEWFSRVEKTRLRPGKRRWITPKRLFFSYLVCEPELERHLLGLASRISALNERGSTHQLLSQAAYDLLHMWRPAYDWGGFRT
jgi:hypothetical protein